MRTLSLIVLSSVIAACTGAPPPAPPPEPKEEVKPPEPEVKEEPKAEAPTVAIGEDDGGEYEEVVVESDGDNMAYKQTEITIKANTKTRFKMVNNATTAAMVHNIVIVKKGSEQEVGMAAVSIPREKEHIPANANILAATKLAGPGETTTVVVDLPPGEYSYICTFPGHFSMMKGVLHVVE